MKEAPRGWSFGGATAPRGLRTPCNLTNEDEASLPEELQRPLDSGAVQSTNEDEARLPEELQRPLDPGAVQCEDEDENNLLEEPQCPLDSDCCGNGCSPCVFDLYERDLAVWRCRREQARLGPALTPSGPSAAALSPDHYTALPLLDVTPVSDDAAVYRFALPTGTALCLRPGQHLVLREHDAAGRPLTRPYTPVSPRDAAGYFDVYIRRYADGAASACVRRWRPGLHVRWRGPFGEFQPRAGDARLVLLAAGTGVAPFVALVRAVLADEADETRLVLLLAVRRLRDVFPRDELAEFARAWNFTYTLFVSGGEEDSARYGEPVRWRRPGSQDVQEVMRQMALKTRYLVCGTRSFEKDMLNYLGAAGVQDDDIFRF
ncbi:NADH-cytochrome b5 reductase-like [Pollicipes pollicipes]|uniref:NADH-cytochrome b5 reductase-like n=1 Tax=Pollicipes pollicipes TaxID=41117 RepID=UPI00188540F9|nr:NADH-cytochrome b5 reductase-like [Pollicipes pollicipes]